MNSLAANRKEGLFGAHQVQRFNRDADETLAWIAEKVGIFIFIERTIEIIEFQMDLLPGVSIL